jgi:tetratricopeptide (TPR) repeat protein
MFLRSLIFVLSFILLITASTARAEWHEASSDHFVIYANQPEKQLRKFSERLEKYHAAVEILLNFKGQKPSLSNRLTVYVLQSTDNISKLSDGKSKNIVSFYKPRAGAAILTTLPMFSNENQSLPSNEFILFYQYAYHVIYSDSSLGYPLWYSQGFAQFLATAQFEKDGSVGLGRIPSHITRDLALARHVPIEKLLDTKAYEASRLKDDRYDQFSLRSWLLFHYLTFSERRAGQKKNYLSYLRQGIEELEAAKKAFGDLKKLDAEIEQYSNQRQLEYFKISPDKFESGPSSLRKLDVTEAEVMPLVMQSRSTEDKSKAVKILPEVQKIAAKFPNSAAVLTALSEAEYDAGNDDAAIAASDRVTAIEPNNINALLQKGYALFRKAENSNANKETWSAVRKQFMKVNAIENNHPIPLIYFYKSYVQSKMKPTKNALEGYIWALKQAPFDLNLRMNVGEALLENNYFDGAIATLRSITIDARGKEMAEKASEMIAIAEKKKAAQPEKSNPLLLPNRQ